MQTDPSQPASVLLKPSLAPLYPYQQQHQELPVHACAPAAATVVVRRQRRPAKVLPACLPSSYQDGGWVE